MYKTRLWRRDRDIPLSALAKRLNPPQNLVTQVVARGHASGLERILYPS